MRAGGAERTLILGTTPLARRLAELIRSRPDGHYVLLGVVCEPDAAAPRSFPCPLLGTLDDLGRLLREHKPQRVIVALAERRRRLPVHHLIQARVIHHVRVENGDEVYERFSGKLATRVVETIQQAANTGAIGDGKIFVMDLAQAVRIRTGEINDMAL